MKFLLIDGNSMLSRAFYGIRLLTAPDGSFTNAVLGFFNTYIKVVSEEKPDGVCVCFDVHAPTFRKEMFDAYKAGRSPTPPELIAQIPLMKELLDLVGIARLELAGYEADDLLGTLSQMMEETGHEAVILTGDRDSLQLAGDRTKVKIATTKAGQPITVDYDPLKIMLEFGVMPKELIDVKALMGDRSDNIPGVAGIGEKTALSLIAQNHSVDALYENLEGQTLTKSVRAKLEAGRESAILSRKLAEINRRVPVDFKPEDAILSGETKPEAFDRFSALGLFSLLDRLGIQKDESTAVPALEYPESEPFPADFMPGEKTAFTLTPDGFTVFDGTNLYAKLTDEEGYHDLLGVYFGSAGEKITHDLKSAHSLLLWEGLEAVGPFFDTLTGAAVLSLPQDLKSLARRYYGEEPENGKEAVAAYALEAEFRPLLEDFRELYYDMEIPLSRVIAGMEFYGFSLDTETLADYGSALALLAADNEERIYAIAGEKFNIHSPKQLGEILFEKMGLPVIKKTKSGYSTDAEVLKKLAPRSEIINLILEYRSLTKLKATYADGLARGVSERDGRVHSTFFQTGAITGRISSSEPNLQNIPVRTPLGRELRKMFVAPPGYVLVDADYSQIELRLLAHIAGDDNMIEAFEEGQDIHTLTASQVFGVPPFAVTPEMRSSAKAVNFGIIYGISDFALAEDIGVSRKEAKEYIERYLESYPGVKQYMKDVVEKARETGYVETLFGRRRYIPDIKAKNFNLRSAAERIALNAPIQGTAADVIKLAMIKIHNRLKTDSPRSRLILQIHDELIVEAPEEEVELVKRLVKEEMESVVRYRVTLEADAGVGKTWYEAKQ